MGWRTKQHIWAARLETSGRLNKVLGGTAFILKMSPSNQRVWSLGTCASYLSYLTIEFDVLALCSTFTSLWGESDMVMQVLLFDLHCNQWHWAYCSDQIRSDQIRSDQNCLTYSTNLNLAGFEVEQLLSLLKSATGSCLVTLLYKSLHIEQCLRQLELSLVSREIL
jgi:hypothetical protein